MSIITDNVAPKQQAVEKYYVSINCFPIVESKLIYTPKIQLKNYCFALLVHTETQTHTYTHKHECKLTQRRQNTSRPKHFAAQGWQKQQTAHSFAKAVLQRIQHGDIALFSHGIGEKDTA
jgi:hypothetical protein